MRRAWVVVLVVVMGGCRRDAAYPRLGAGAEAFLFDAASPVVVVETAMGQGLAGLDVEDLPGGTRVMVLDDPGDEAESGRDVAFVVQEGKHRGLNAHVKRRMLRVVAPAH